MRRRKGQRERERNNGSKTKQNERTNEQKTKGESISKAEKRTLERYCQEMELDTLAEGKIMLISIYLFFSFLSIFLPFYLRCTITRLI